MSMVTCYHHGDQLARAPLESDDEHPCDCESDEARAPPLESDDHPCDCESDEAQAPPLESDADP